MEVILPVFYPFTHHMSHSFSYLSSLPLVTEPIAVASNDYARDHLHKDRCAQAFGRNTLSKPHSACGHERWCSKQGHKRWWWGVVAQIALHPLRYKNIQVLPPPLFLKKKKSASLIVIISLDEEDAWIREHEVTLERAKQVKEE